MTKQPLYILLTLILSASFAVSAHASSECAYGGVSDGMGGETCNPAPDTPVSEEELQEEQKRQEALRCSPKGETKYHTGRMYIRLTRVCKAEGRKVYAHLRPMDRRGANRHVHRMSTLGTIRGKRMRWRALNVPTKGLKPGYYFVVLQLHPKLRKAHGMERLTVFPIKLSRRTR